MNKLVMVIDDSLTVRKIIETSLRREGIASVSYADGIEALRALSEKRHPVPDLVILDIGLPKMDGYEIARHLKAKQQFGNTIIIMLSSRDGVIDRLKGRLVGALAFYSSSTLVPPLSISLTPLRHQNVPSLPALKAILSLLYPHLRLPVQFPGPRPPSPPK